MSTGGLIDSSNYGEVIRSISQKKRSGLLEVDVSKKLTRFVFVSGRLISASRQNLSLSAYLHSWLQDVGRLPLTLEIPPDLNLTEYFDFLSKEAPGVIELEEFKEFAKECVLDILFTADFKTGGYYNFKSEVQSGDRDLGPNISPSQFLLDMVSYERDDTEYQAKVPPNAWVRRSDEPIFSPLIDKELLIHRLLEVPREVVQLKRLTLINDFAFREAFLSLLADGVIVLCDPVIDVPPPVVEPEEEPIPVAAPFLQSESVELDALILEFHQVEETTPDEFKEHEAIVEEEPPVEEIEVEPKPEVIEDTEPEEEEKEEEVVLVNEISQEPAEIENEPPPEIAAFHDEDLKLDYSTESAPLIEPEEYIPNFVPIDEYEIPAAAAPVEEYIEAKESDSDTESEEPSQNELASLVEAAEQSVTSEEEEETGSITPIHEEVPNPESFEAPILVEEEEITYAAPREETAEERGLVPKPEEETFEAAPPNAESTSSDEVFVGHVRNSIPIPEEFPEEKEPVVTVSATQKEEPLSKESISTPPYGVQKPEEVFYPEASDDLPDDVPLTQLSDKPKPLNLANRSLLGGEEDEEEDWYYEDPTLNNGENNSKNASQVRGEEDERLRGRRLSIKNPLYLTKAFSLSLTKSTVPGTAIAIAIMLLTFLMPLFFWGRIYQAFK
jgi:hypothetical protein